MISAAIQFLCIKCCIFVKFLLSLYTLTNDFKTFIIGLHIEKPLLFLLYNPNVTCKLKSFVSFKVQ